METTIITMIMFTLFCGSLWAAYQTMKDAKRDREKRNYFKNLK